MEGYNEHYNTVRSDMDVGWCPPPHHYRYFEACYGFWWSV